ncbi:hypothetical protein DYU11_10920 [Fibrisoma montanum]|uniref:Energy transducer TonB n=1 Tax=Fibrisoma montanum TaxID=2305895 RepID=A0A418MAY3_9BACT|nr:hypothetical protein [Fibrisoma montanum]RIV23500.1 hypothetical protein DYU11_10920 [Fibrisoma montanum]
MNRITFENEKEVRVKALAGAMAINLLVLAILLLVHLSNSVPQPPPIQFVEVNFGTDAIGSGRIQTLNRPNPSPRAEDVKKAEDRPNPKVTTTPRVERTPVAPVPKVVEAKTSKTIAEKPDIASKVESPVSVPEKAEPKKVEATAPKPTPAPPRAEPVKKVETVDPNALYKRSSGGGGSNGTVGRASGTGGNNNGDDASGVGDKGNPDGKLDAKEYYGKPGGASSGVALNVSGWVFGNNNLSRDDSDEDGKIVYRVQVDGDGNIVTARPVQQTVSPAVESFYRRQVLRFKLRPKGSATPAGVATGTLTINISAR